MTVPSTRFREDYAGNGSATSFPYAFRIFKNTDLVVTKTDNSGNETTLTLGTDYTVTGAGSYNGGAVVLTTALPTSYRLTIERVLAIRQDTDLRNQGEFLAETHEDAFDRLTMIVQRLAGYIGMGQDGTLRTLLLGTGDVDGAGAFRARGNRISGLGNPVSGQDAVTKAWFDQAVTTSVNQAANSAASAAASAAAAEDSEQASLVIATQFGDMATAVTQTEAARDTALSAKTAAQSSAVGAASSVTSALIAKSQAEAARDAAQLSAGVYADTATGIAAVADGRYFSVPSASAGGYLTLYKRTGSSATEIAVYPSLSGVAKAVEPFRLDGTYSVGSRLSVVPAAGWDAEYFQWFRNGAVIPGQISDSYVLTGDDAGAFITFVPVNQRYRGTPASMVKEVFSRVVIVGDINTYQLLGSDLDNPHTEMSTLLGVPCYVSSVNASQTVVQAATLLEAAVSKYPSNTLYLVTTGLQEYSTNAPFSSATNANLATMAAAWESLRASCAFKPHATVVAPIGFFNLTNPLSGATMNDKFNDESLGPKPFNEFIVLPKIRALLNSDVFNESGYPIVDMYNFLRNDFKLINNSTGTRYLASAYTTVRQYIAGAIAWLIVGGVKPAYIKRRDTVSTGFGGLTVTDRNYFSATQVSAGARLVLKKDFLDANKTIGMTPTLSGGTITQHGSGIADGTVSTYTGQVNVGGNVSTGLYLSTGQTLELKFDSLDPSVEYAIQVMASRNLAGNVTRVTCVNTGQYVDITTNAAPAQIGQLSAKPNAAGEITLRYSAVSGVAHIGAIKFDGTTAAKAEPVADPVAPTLTTSVSGDGKVTVSATHNASDFVVVEASDGATYCGHSHTGQVSISTEVDQPKGTLRIYTMNRAGKKSPVNYVRNEYAAPKASALSPINKVVIFGASIEHGICSAWLDSMSNYMQKRYGRSITFVMKAWGGQKMDSLQNLWDTEVKAGIFGEKTTAVITMPMGNDISANNPYATMDARGLMLTRKKMYAQYQRLLRSIVANGNICIPVNTTFRNYEFNSVLDEAKGSKPFNEAILWPVASTMPLGVAEPSGRPLFDLYDIPRNYYQDIFLPGDEVHFTNIGYYLLRTYYMRCIEALLAGTTPPREPRIESPARENYPNPYGKTVLLYGRSGSNPVINYYGAQTRHTAPGGDVYTFPEDAFQLTKARYGADVTTNATYCGLPSVGYANTDLTFANAEALSYGQTRTSTTFGVIEKLYGFQPNQAVRVKILSFFATGTDPNINGEFKVNGSASKTINARYTGADILAGHVLTFDVNAASDGTIEVQGRNAGGAFLCMNALSVEVL